VSDLDLSPHRVQYVAFAAIMSETTLLGSLEYNREQEQRRVNECLETKQVYQTRKLCLPQSDGDLQPKRSYVSWKKPMVAWSVARTALSFVGKDYTLQIYPSDGNNDPWDSSRACYPRSESVSPMIQPPKR
jgi:hypothetical protein